MKLNAARFGRVHQRHVQVPARNGVNNLVLISAVGLKSDVTCGRMHHAALHRNKDAAHIVPQASLAQCVNTARRNGEIYRPARTDLTFAHVWASFVDIYLEPTLGQRKRKKRSGEASTHHCNGVRTIVHCGSRAYPCRASGIDYPCRYVLASQSSGKNFFSSVSFKYDDPALPPVPTRKPIVRSTI